MEIKKIKLSETSPALKDSDASLTIYLPEDNECVTKRDFMVVCPGGAYEYRSPREGEIVALRFICEGFAAAVLNYTVKVKYPTPQLELGAAIKYLKEHKDELNITDNVSIVGFSAGGHLVTSYGCWYQEIAGILKIEPSTLRPTSIVAGYPVISAYLVNLSATIKHISGMDPILMEKMSVEKHVGNDYPPTFLFTTKEDTCVSPTHSEAFAKALKEKGVKHEFLYFEHGEHGSSLANRSVYQKGHVELERAKKVRDWISQAADFIYSL